MIIDYLCILVANVAKRSKKVHTAPLRIIPSRHQSSEVITSQNLASPEKNRKEKKSNKKIPTAEQLSLLYKRFTSDLENFYVVEVKYYEPFSEVCCISVPCDGSIDDAKKLYADVYMDIPNDNSVFDCEYVSKTF